MNKTKFPLFIFIVFSLISCTFTTTKTKNPVFNDMSKVQSELNTLIKAEGYNLAGKEITVNKSTTSELEVNVTNGVNVPTDDNERKSLGKSIANSIKNNLKDSKEYDKYKVLFVTKVEDGSTIKRSWVGNEFYAANYNCSQYSFAAIRTDQNLLC